MNEAQMKLARKKAKLLRRLLKEFLSAKDHDARIDAYYELTDPALELLEADAD